MGRTVHVVVPSGPRQVDITDETASRLLDAALLIEVGDEVQINPRFDVFGHLAAMLVGVVDAQVDRRYTIGDATMRHVFEPCGLKDMSDMQAVMDSVERALAAMRAALDFLAPPPGMVAFTTNGTTRIVPADEPVFLLRGQDRAAPDTIRDWCNRADALGASHEMLEEASRLADKMEEWPVKKVPDLPSQHVPIAEPLPETPPTIAAEHKGLPVAGYKPTQSQEAVDLVNEGKELEERVLRWIERVGYDTMGFRIGGSFDIQKGFMQIYRAAFQPNGSRITLPEDSANLGI